MIEINTAVAVIGGILGIASIMFNFMWLLINRRVTKVETEVEELKKKNTSQDLCIDRLEHSVARHDAEIKTIKVMHDDILKIKVALNIKD